jgi:hypothetical protein
VPAQFTVDQGFFLCFFFPQKVSGKWNGRTHGESENKRTEMQNVRLWRVNKEEYSNDKTHVCMLGNGDLEGVIESADVVVGGREGVNQAVCVGGVPAKETKKMDY